MSHEMTIKEIHNPSAKWDCYNKFYIKRGTALTLECHGSVMESNFFTAPRDNSSLKFITGSDITTFTSVGITPLCKVD